MPSSAGVDAGELDGYLPDDESLAAGLSAVFGQRVTLVERTPNLRSATYSNDVVHCQLEDGRQLCLFCKFEEAMGDNYGHKFGVPYETVVYRDVIAPLGLRPRFHGSYIDGEGRRWLVLDFLSDSTWAIARFADGGLTKAAEWIGSFHALNEARLRAGASFADLIVYDEAYYLGWVARTLDFTRRTQPGRFHWLPRLCERFPKVLPYLLEPLTVVHGEYYKNNVLLDDGVICPVDWESAALGIGEIDLAALVERPWSTEIVDECVRAYAEARWPHGAPEEFRRRLDSARLYLDFRWLGHRIDWTQNASRRFDDLRELGVRLGLL